MPVGAHFSQIGQVYMEKEVMVFPGQVPSGKR